MDTGLATLDEFQGLKVERLDTYDFLALSFYAARGLPGTENSNLEHWYAKRDAWVYRIQFETARHLYRYDPKAERPTETFYGNSLGRFLCYFMLQVLQQDCGVKYHPNRKMNPGSCKPRDVFAHGIMDDDGEGGTCASMPVVYVSVARRLGYPVYLVETRGHLFCRWDDPKGATIRWRNPDVRLRVPPERFNFDGSGDGIGFHSDDHYRTWPEPWTDFEIEQGYYLRSQSARQAFAAMLFERGECFWDFGMIGDALKSYHFARQIVPDDERYNQHHAARFKQHQFQRFMLEEEQRKRQLRLGAAAQVHAPGCTCIDCWQSRNQPNRDLKSPPHGPSCQCLECRNVRAAANVPRGMPGHAPNCGCAGCHQNRHSPMPVFPGIPGFNPHF
jgi:hypothetical protein